MTLTTVPDAPYRFSIDNPVSDDLLPNTLNELLAAAILDARHLNPATYYPSFIRWHRSPMNGHCEISLAGSIIARTYHSAHRLNIIPAMFSLAIKHKLYAIDDMRIGKWLSAFMVLYKTSPSPEIEKSLVALPQPAHFNFKGWLQFNAHLDSLEPIVDELREIERDAGMA